MRAAINNPERLHNRFNLSRNELHLEKTNRFRIRGEYRCSPRPWRYRGWCRLPRANRGSLSLAASKSRRGRRVFAGAWRPRRTQSPRHQPICTRSTHRHVQILPLPPRIQCGRSPDFDAPQGRGRGTRRETPGDDRAAEPRVSLQGQTFFRQVP